MSARVSEKLLQVVKRLNLDYFEHYGRRGSLSVRELADYQVFTLKDVKKLKDPEDLYKLGMMYRKLLEYVKGCSEDEVEADVVE